MFRVLGILAVCCVLVFAETDPAYPLLEKAYSALKSRSFDEAISAFERAVAVAPTRVSIRKDLGYAYLKVGRPEAARDQFAEAMKLDPADRQVAMEFAYLCHETKQTALARRTFDVLRKSGDPKAEEAFQNIDKPLSEGIVRWTKALELSPDNFSAHFELAQLAEQRDDLKLASEHFVKAWNLRPTVRMLLVDLGRVWKASGRHEDSVAALVAASRGTEPRAAEAARKLLPQRYPYVYEFQKALQLDPKNVELRRELAYLHLAMGNKKEAEAEFERVLAIDSDDVLSAAQLGFLRMSRNDTAGAMPLLEKASQSGNSELAGKVRAMLDGKKEPRKSDEQVKEMAERSIKAGYLADAVRYLRALHESNPNDYGIMLRLGFTYNMLHDDRRAVALFKQAKNSPDPKVAEAAAQAYKNLSAPFKRVRTTVWTFPFYSSRWKDLFSYSQIKTDFRIGSLPIRPYLSTRFIGDLKQRTDATPTLGPQYLSESSFICAAGLATSSWKGLSAWGEAGTAVRYVNRDDVGRAVPDYRGGIAYGRGVGHLLGSKGTGVFAETNIDGIYVSRFNDDVLLYLQTRSGYTLGSPETFQAQFYWNANITADWKREYWANFVELGPGVKFRTGFMPRGLYFMVNTVRGKYTVKEGNPRGPIFDDLRAGFWYAFTR